MLRAGRYRHVKMTHSLYRKHGRKYFRQITSLEEIFCWISDKLILDASFKYIYLFFHQILTQMKMKKWIVKWNLMIKLTLQIGFISIRFLFRLFSFWHIYLTEKWGKGHPLLQIYSFKIIFTKNLGLTWGSLIFLQCLP